MISGFARSLRPVPIPGLAGAIAQPQPEGPYEGRIMEPALAPSQAADRATSRASLGNVQVLRGAAAAAVLVSHVTHYAQSFRGTAQPIWSLDAFSGLIGVAVFFAISGYLMAGLIGRGDPWTFLAHRVVRIFPTYFAVVALFAAVFAALKIGFSVNLFALSLAPVGPRSYPLNVEWTLVFETSFYVGLFLLACTGHVSRLVPVVLVWLGLLTVAWFIRLHSPTSTMNGAPYLLPFSPACVAFAGGLLLPRLIARGWMRPGMAWIALPVLAAAVVAVDDDARRWLGGVAAVLLVGAAVCSRQLTRESLVGRAAIAFGDWSYALYLVHVPVIILVLQHAPVNWSGPMLWAASCAAALGATLVLGPLDVGLYRRLRRKIDRASPSRLWRGVAVYLAIFACFTVYASVETGLNARREYAARAALSALPTTALTSTASVAAAVAERGRDLPRSVRGGIETFERVSTKEFILGAWAFDPEKPERALTLAALCGAEIVALERATRLRPKLATVVGLEASRGRRIGYRLRLKAGACPSDTWPVAVLIGQDGRMSVLSRDERAVDRACRADATGRAVDGAGKPDRETGPCLPGNLSSDATAP